MNKISKLISIALIAALLILLILLLCSQQKLQSEIYLKETIIENIPLYYKLGTEEAIYTRNESGNFIIINGENK